MSTTSGIPHGLRVIENTPVEKLTTGQTLKQLGRNAKDILSLNSLSAQLQNPHKLKNNSLIISTFILVVSRILVAHFSAVKAKGTDEEPYRAREAIRTFIREVCGWTLSYVVLRRIQAMAKLAMEKFFAIRHNQDPTSMKLMWDSARNAFKRIRYEVPKLKDAADPDLFKVGRTDRVEAMMNGLRKVGLGRLVKHADPTRFLKALYQWAPIVVGSIPSVLLAGYFLERFTRDHSDKVVETVSRKFNLQKPGEGAHPALCEQRFNNFMQHVQQKQAERGAYGQ